MSPKIDHHCAPQRHLDCNNCVSVTSTLVYYTDFFFWTVKILPTKSKLKISETIFYTNARYRHGSPMSVRSSVCLSVTSRCSMHERQCHILPADKNVNCLKQRSARLRMSSNLAVTQFTRHATFMCLSTI